jgi:hypothetical protein
MGGSKEREGEGRSFRTGLENYSEIIKEVGCDMEIGF